MTRGEETQEPLPESRETNETKPESQENEIASRRDQEVMAEPEAVVERERSVQESEAIESAVVEAVEAVEAAETAAAGGHGTEEALEAASDRGPETEDRAAEAAATAEDGDRGTEGEADRGPKTEDREQAAMHDDPVPPPPPPDREAPASLDETSFKVESQPEGRDLFPEDTPFQVENLPEDGELILDDSSFKFYTPGPGQVSREEVPEQAGRVQPDAEEDRGETLEADAFKPIPAREAVQEAAREDPSSEVPGADWAESAEEPMEPIQESQEEDGGSILIGGQEGEEPEELVLEEGLEDTAVQDGMSAPAKEVEEYWEPPEMYFYRDQNGDVHLVDAEGKQISSPPHIQHTPDQATDSFTAWYHDDQAHSFNIQVFPGHAVEEMYVYTAADGTKTVVDKNGNPLDSPPQVWNDPTGEDGGVIQGPDGKMLKLPDYQPPTEDIYLYIAKDGTKTIVGEDGTPVQWPPMLFPGGADEEYYFKDAEGNKVVIEAYQPPTTEIYVYTAQDGSLTVVDKEGHPIKSPPSVFRLNDDQIVTMGPDGSKLEIPAYQPPTQGIYVYTAQDGSRTIVDENGSPIDSPPPIWNDPASEGSSATMGPNGEKISLEAYQPPTEGLFVHTAMDGTKTVVDANGNPVNSPPHIWNNPPDYQGALTMGLDGKPVVLQEYKPPSSHWKEP